MIKLNKIYCEDCLKTLKRMPDNFIDCCITSPPYYGLRDYDHPDQIGLEATPELYVQKLVKIFNEVKRVLKKDGTLWLNLGDSYAGSGKGRNGNGEIGVLNSQKQRSNAGANIGNLHGISKTGIGLKPKDLIGIPWMVAFALRADGWWLRQDIIWHKPNPMPESVTDRCTKAHEYIFLLSKSQKYYYDQEAIKEPSVENNWRSRLSRESIKSKPDEKKNGIRYKSTPRLRPNGLPTDCGAIGFSSSCGANGIDRNKRSVWTVNTMPYSGAHFATFPEDLIIPCIKAGCPEKGIVLDPFMGAGTTALVSHKLNRKWIGSEISHEYCIIAEKRIKPYLMQQKIIFD